MITKKKFFFTKFFFYQNFFFIQIFFTQNFFLIQIFCTQKAALQSGFTKRLYKTALQNVLTF